MKELASSFAQLILIIMVMITLAVSSAAVAQWASGGESSNDTVGAQQSARL